MKESLQNPALIEAVQRAAQSIGIPTLAAEMDMRPSTLYNALNPYGDRSIIKLGLENAVYILRRSGDATALEMIAADLGYTLRRISQDCPESGTIEGECCEDIDALAEFSRLVRTTGADRASILTVITAAAKAKDEIDQTVRMFSRKWEDRK